MIFQVLLTFDAPSGAQKSDIQNYIKAELECAGDRRLPEDPLFHSLSGVTVKFVTKEQIAKLIARNV